MDTFREEAVSIRDIQQELDEMSREDLMMISALVSEAEHLLRLELSVDAITERLGKFGKALRKSRRVYVEIAVPMHVNNFAFLSV